MNVALPTVAVPVSSPEMLNVPDKAFLRGAWRVLGEGCVFILGCSRMCEP
jgi:hypothetical protein